MASCTGANSQVGLYMNTLPIQLMIDETSLNDSVRQTHEKLDRLMAHENASLLIAQRCARTPKGVPLFNSVLDYRHHVHHIETAGMTPELRETWTRPQSIYPLTVCVDDTFTGLKISSQTAATVDSQRVCTYMQRALESIVGNLIEEPRKSINSIQILPDRERQELLETWNTVDMPAPDSICIHQLFEKQAILTPTKTALIHENEKVTYTELNARANCLAHYLIELGVKPECLVGICISPSLAMIVGLLAIHKAGGAFVSLDSSYPRQRQLQIIVDTELQIIIADNEGADRLGGQIANILVVMNSNDQFHRAASNPVVRDRGNTDLAYVMYTSGSTGQPKGVMVEHRNIVRLFETTEPLFQFSQNDVWCLVHSIAFGLSVWEIWGALRYGGQLVIMSREEVRSIDVTYNLLCKHQVSVLCQTPSQFRMMNERLLIKPVRDCLQHIIFAGESLDAKSLQSFYEGRNDTIPRLYNMYGTTEVTVYATFKMFDGARIARSTSLIGRHLPDTRLYVLDENRQPAPLGVVGDLYVGSPRLARGYWNRPELTTERFIGDLFGDSVESNIYKTGDLARFLPDGSLEYIGRDDQQVKLRGYRIELGEIEACFKSHEAVRDARVLMIGDDIYKRLVAYIVANRQTDLELTLRSYAESQLPEFMVPVAIMIIDEIPLTLNGKIDLQALPSYQRRDLSRTTYEAPRGEVELELAAVWKELLDVEEVSRHDSFFALGGHSLLAIRMIEHMRHHGYRITINDLYENSTLFELALTALDDAPPTVPENLIQREILGLTPQMLPLIDLTQTDIDCIVSQVPGGINNIQDIYALSPLQDGLLFHHVLDTETDPYLLRSHIAVSNISILERYVSAMQKVINRHDVLRTAFFWENLSTPAQVVFRVASLSVTEKTLDVEPEHDESTHGIIFQYQKMNLQQAPLLHFMTARRSDNCWDLGQLIHHIVVDHGTLEIMRAEIYAILIEQEFTLPGPIPFRNFIAHVRDTMRSEADQTLFAEMLTEIDDPTLCFGLSGVHSDGFSFGEAFRILSDEINVQLRRQAAHLNVSPATLCHVAWGLVVSKTSNRKRPVFGTVLSGRTNVCNVTSRQMGPYINTLPIKLIIENTPLIECVRQTHERLGHLLKHENASLVMAQRCSRVPCGTPLFNSILNYRHNAVLTKTDTSILGIHLIREHKLTHYFLACSVDVDSFSIKISLQTAIPVDPKRVCAYMRRALESMVERFTQEPEKCMNFIQILPDCERRLLLETSNIVDVSAPDSVCMHQLFEKQAILRSTETALIRENKRMTYNELNTLANNLAHYLIELGVGPECLVGLCVSPSFAMIVGLLAIHKAGGAYVPLDPSYPERRLLQMVGDTGLRIIIADETGADRLKDRMTDTLVLINPNDRFERGSFNPIIRNLSQVNLAYVIYTSGSTGQPKGVMVEHRNIVRLFETTDTLFHFSHNDVWCLIHSIAFDFSVWEIWGALRYGGQLVIMSREEVRSNDDTFDLVCKHQVSVLCQTPSQFVMFHERLLAKPVRDNLRKIIFGGESLDATCLRSFYDRRPNPVPQLSNMYGPTEVTVFASFQMLDRAETLKSISLIGKHLPDTQLYVLDENFHPTPLGVVGDLYVGSPRLARGYWNQPELSIERFIVHPFDDSVEGYIYKTGDLARFRPDGSLEYIGRDDQQVKLRGYRIELGEVEACLSSHEAVRDARVLMIGDDIYKRLVAYVVVKRQTDLERNLLSYARSQLPEFMVPVAIMIIDEIPLTFNGKTDFQALPSFERRHLSQNTFEAPRGAVELKLAAVWEELLDVRDVSRHDSFFALGGHSLLAIRMIERMRHHGYRITINDVYVNSTLFELALTALDDAPPTVPENSIHRGIPRLTPEMLPLINLTQTDIDCIVSQVPGGVDNIQDIYALSPLQDGILFHHMLNIGSDPYLLRSHMIVSNISILERYISAVQMVVDRHDVLRTAFFWNDLSTPAQVVLRQASLSVTEETLDVGPENAESTDDRIFQYRKINLQEAPLLHFITARRSDNSWDLGQLFHHIIVDHESLEIMNAEICALLVEQEMTLPEPIPFRNFIAHVRRTICSAAHQLFFREMLNEIDDPTLCFGLSAVHSDGSSVDESHQTLSYEINLQLRRQAAKLGVSPATVCHVAWGLVVSRTSKQEKPVFGTVLFGRTNVRNVTSRQMGLYINTLPIKLMIDNTPLIECVCQTHERLGHLLKHENASLVMAQRCSQVPCGAPLFNSILNYRHNVTLTKIDTSIPGIHLIRTHERSNYSLACAVDDDSSSIKISLQTAQPIDSEHVCAYMQHAVESIVESLTQEPEKSINSIQILPDCERRLYLETWNTVNVSAPDSVCMHQLFEKQAILSSTETALIRGNERITYAELNTLANNLAHYLIELGVRPECLVGICVSPSFAMIVGLLAIHKAGGAYVPLDPSYPERRLLNMVGDTGLRIIIADETGADRLRNQMTDTLVLINPNDRFERGSFNPIIRNLSQMNLAYVMYTSGSTGKPKGVMVEHRNIVRLFETTETLFHFSQNDVWCLVHSLAFDFSVWEVWGALRYGGQLVIMSREEVRSNDDTFDIVCKHQVSVLCQSPSQFIMFHERLLANPVRDNLRKIMFGGESLDATCLRSFYERRANPVPQLTNMYGPTEATVLGSFQMLDQADTLKSISLIGKHLPDTQLYVLDENFHPTPLGVVGDLYVGSPRLARGYWNQPELSIERFIVHPFNDSVEDYIYKTGDLARFRPDGSLEFIGRDDQQVKLRGFRIELGEVEACLSSHEAVRDARVLIIGDDIYKRLVAYVVVNRQTDLERNLLSYARSQLPEFMVPVAIMIIDEIPLTLNGKTDFQALPSFERRHLSQNTFEAPRGAVELKLAAVWEELLDVRDVSRHDSFFALGGYSLLAIRMIERMRHHGYRITINDVYVNSTLFELALTALDAAAPTIPENLIQRGVSRLTPEMLPLVDLTQTDIDLIVSRVQGGIDNIQDIYALSPLQDGMLFHHLLDTETDPYLLMNQKIFPDIAALQRYILAVKRVTNRHDILRTAFFWKDMTIPAQVVLRRIELPVVERTLDLEMDLDRREYCDRPNRWSFDLQQAPLLRLIISRTNNDEWLLHEVIHHIIIDNVARDIMNTEIDAFCNEQEESLPRPTPFRNFIAHVRSSMRPEVHEKFFTDMLADIDEPTLCFDLASTHGHVSSIVTSQSKLSTEMKHQLIRQAEYFDTTLATFCHLSWGLVVSKISRRAKIVFGTVLFGRMASSSGVNTQVGLYINTLPIKLIIDETSLNDCVRQTHHKMGQLMKHEHATLVTAQRCGRIPTGTPLFNSLLNHRHHVRPIETDNMTQEKQITWVPTQIPYPLTICIDDTSTGMTISSYTAQSIDSERVCTYMQRALVSIVDSLVQEAGKSIDSIQISPESERQLLLRTWNTIDMPAPDSICMHQLFEKQVISTPTKTALIHENEHMTYTELNARANCLAHYLIQLGVGPECLVGLCLSPSFAMIVGLLAIHKAGGAYVPLDPANPEQRLLQIVTDTELRIVIADKKEADRLGNRMTDTLVLINTEEPLKLATNPVIRDLSQANLAYLMYTSGSTGRPKGVMVEHRNIVRLFETTDTLFHFSQNDVWCLVHSIAFDFSVWEVWGALRYGGQLVIMSREEVRSNDDTFDLVCKHQVSVLCQSPSQFMMFYERLLAKPVRDNLRRIIFGGESLDATCLRSFYERRTNPVPQLSNMYGPTEVTVFASFQMLDRTDTLKSISLIGKHLPDTQLYVLDGNLHPTPLGVVGDLYVGGSRLARGYWNRPELSIERFIGDPFSDSVEGIIYKTGDLARFLPDGSLEYIGRDDQQVKLRGYRIELGEIEACFRSHEAVRDARVLMIGDNIYQRLVAYIVANRQTDLELTLRSYAKSQLPEFMVPVAIMIIDEIPLTLNGKIDLQALPSYERRDLSRTTYEAPRGAVELELAAVWKELLDVKDISRHDSFFALGGHSLLAIRMIERMRHHNYRITINDLYVNSTLSELALTALDDAPPTVPENLIQRGIPRLTPEMLPLIDLTQTDIDCIVSQVPGGIDNIQDIYALSPLQDGILFHHLLNVGSDPYLLRSLMTVSNISILERYISAIQIVIDRHDVLRTAFYWENLTTAAQVVFREASLSVTEETLDIGLEQDESTHSSTLQSRKLNLHEAPLLHFITARASDNSWNLGQLLHHIIADHETLEIMSTEIRTLLVEGEIFLPEPIPFRNFIAHVRRTIFSEAHQNFFLEMLNAIDYPTLCFGIPVAHSDGSSVDESRRILSDEINVQLRRQAAKLDVSPATLCHVAWGLVVSRTSKREKPIFGTVLFGRTNVRNVTNRQMGLYINTLPIKLIIDNTSLIECICQTHERLGHLLKHENASLVMAQRCSRVPCGAPLFNSILNYRHNVTLTETDNSILGIHSIRASERTNYPLACSVDDDSSSITISLLTEKPVDSERVCAYMQRALESIVESFTQVPGKSINSIQVLPDCERQLLLNTWTTVHVSAPDSVCMHQLFEKQASLTPTKIALIRGRERMTYAELNTRANCLAHHLIELGVGPEYLVGLCVFPSFAMIVGLLAIHKAGGAYVPLDPSYPEQRVLQTVEDTAIQIIIADEKGADQLRNRKSDTLVLIDPNHRFDPATYNPIICDLSQANLAYVMYTSGSTGKPKGVMVEHRNIVRLFETTEPLFRFSQNDVWCLVHSIAFDVSVWEIWGTLRYGGQLVIMSREEVRSIEETYDLICEHQVSVLCQTPSQFKMLVERLLAKPIRDHLKKIIFAGESLDGTCLRSFYERRADAMPQLCNMYGITEATVHASFKMLHEGDTLKSNSLIGRHLPDTRIYVLDENRHPAPLGVVGDLFVGGPGLTRGYWNRPELTMERFMVDPFSDSVDGHIYKTGDLARSLLDGSLEYIGRDDQQVKLRGFRIELGEIEACLRSHGVVRDAQVLMIGDDIHKHLVAYVVAHRQTDLEITLRAYARSQLPEFMVPQAIMIIDEIPLTPNGKIDLQALPSFERHDLSQNTYEAPRGAVELQLAAVWKELLDIEDVSRHDSFFALGGHSLLAMRMIERMRHHGHRITIHDLYVNSTLFELALTAEDDAPLEAPKNLIHRGISKLTPDMLPLIDLTQTDIDCIVSQVPGGIDNIQDIYALSPLQDGILFHHVLNIGTDPYLLRSVMSVSNISILQRYISAIQKVIVRHDVLRTAFFWNNLSTPAQVVFREASLSVTEETLDVGSERDESTHGSIFQYRKLNLQEAPLLHFMAARKSDNNWYLGRLLHHIIADHETLEIMSAEICALLAEQEMTLPKPIPFRNFIADVRRNICSEVHEHFFLEMLTEIDEPTLCFGRPVVYCDDCPVEESRRTLSSGIDVQLRRQAAHLDVSPATICHVAWGVVVSSISKQEKPVFGTVLFGRMNVSNVTGRQMGLYINTLPFKLIIDKTPLIECLRQTHERLGHLLKHENASLVMAQRCSRVPCGTPLFNSNLNYRHNIITQTMTDIVPGVHLIRNYERTHYPVACAVDDDSVSFKISCQTLKPVESERICAYMQRALESIVGSITQEPEKSIDSIRILPESESQLLLETCTAVDVSAPDSVCMHQLFEKQAILTPTATALIHGNQRITYDQLNKQANRLAHYLVEVEVRPECLVGLSVSPSFAMIVGLLAIHKAGGAYVPLDQSYPNERLLQMIKDTGLRIIIADERGVDQLKHDMADSLLLINMNDQIDRAFSNPIVCDLGQANLACVMYTSGSTGQPKGVMVEHRNIVRLFETTEPLFRFSQNDVWCLVHSIAFDVSVWEIWGALRYGGQLVIMSREEIRSIEETYQLVCKHQVSVLCQTPSQFKMLNERLLTKPVRDRLQKIILGGESLDATYLRPFHDMRANSLPQFYNTYGPTEVTVSATLKKIHGVDTLESASLIGKHLPDTHLYVMDGNLQLTPLGVIGDMYVGGPRLARGYWNRPELTMERFIVDPFSDSVDARIYRTGDLARFLPDGSLEYIGRDDQQVKLRGYRIELGEVETCLQSHEGVRDARVLTTGDDIHKRLVAYVVANRQTDLEQTLRSYAKTRLPEFMVPQVIIIIDEIPLTHNGKIDLQALPPFERQDLPLNVYEAPRGEIEMTLATVWAELLDVKDVSRHDSFFALGGHSLLAVRMIERMRRHGHRITINDLYVNSTLFELALTAVDDSPPTVPENLIHRGISKLTPEMFPLIDLTQTDIDRIVSQVPGGIDNIQDIYALSPLQDGILFHHVLNAETDPYLLRIHRNVSNTSILERYISAMQMVIDRHDVLRTAFFWEKLSTPAQVVFREASLSVTKKTPDNEPDHDELSHRCIFQYRTLNLQQAPLLQLMTVRRSDNSWDLRELLHHLIADHESLEFMQAEIHAVMVEQGETLPNSIPFRNFITHVRFTIRSEAHRNFFAEMLTEIDEPTLCFGVSGVHSDSSLVEESWRTLPSEINIRLRRQAAHLDVSPATLCHVAWGLVVSKTSEQEKAVFGTVLFGRTNVSNVMGHQMGLYINNLPIKVIIDNTALIERVRQIHERLGHLLKHEDAPLVMAQRYSRVPHGTSLFNSILNYRHNMTPTQINITIPGIHSIKAQERTHYSLTCTVDDDSVSIKISSQTAQPINSERVCAYMQQALESIVGSLTHEPGKSINCIRILPDSERHLLLETWNTVDMSAPDSICMHQLFEQQAILTPTEPALIRGNERITYAELNARANCLAYYLIDLGVKPECLVGICVSPSFAMIVGLLAIHKAGGAYVPLDPSYPELRLLQMITDTGLRIIIADKTGANQLKNQMADTLVLINPNDRFDQATSNPIVCDLSQANLAYVMYTSGSTGQPKGVMVEHRNIVRLFETTEPLFRFSQNDVWCLVHSIAFDVSVWEIWGALRYGGQLSLLSREEIRSIDETHEILCKHQVSVLCQTPSQMKMLIDRLLAKPVQDHLRKIILAGESLDTMCLRSFYDKRADAVPQLYNMYGPTEGTVYATFKVLHEVDTLKSTSLIGKHLPDTQLYVLDKNRHPTPLGAVGDLYVGGPRLARGYWNRPELTIERFIVNPFGESINAHIYRTGDLARFLPDGSLEYIGRDDQQIKLRGYRIELGEVETCLRSHEAVRDARVLMTGDDIYKRLVAYVVANRQTDLEHTLRSYAKSHLPEFMVPVAIVIIDEIPLTTNGKLDHEALPNPDSPSVARLSYEIPKTHTEWKLATIWSHLLSIDEICRDDNFFVVGGHSLIAMRMISLIAEQGLTCTLNDLFRYPVLRDLASKIEVNSEIQEIYAAIPVRRTGTEPPLFFVPTGLGDYCYVFALAQHLPTCYPIYALPWPPSQEQPLSTMEEMARIMIPLIKAVQPQGPYRICGYSSGGILCHAIASHLHESGDPVAFVGLIDTAFLETGTDRTQRRQLSVIYDLIATIGLGRIDEIVELCNKMADMSFFEFIEAGKQLKLYASTVRSESHAQQLEQRVHFMEMIISYVPKDLGITVHQFNASEPSTAEKYLGGLIGLPCRSRRFDLAYSLPNASIHIVSIPGDHLTMMENSENRLILGTAINAAIHLRS